MLLSVFMVLFYGSGLSRFSWIFRFTFSELISILLGILQGSVLGSPFNYNLYLRFVYSQGSSFLSGENFDQILGELEKHMRTICEWFLRNCLKVNFHLFLS